VNSHINLYSDDKVKEEFRYNKVNPVNNERVETLRRRRKM